MRTGTFIISLDFELMWGMRDHLSLADYGLNVLGVRQSIPALLELFQGYGIHATWATVGFLFFEKKLDLIRNCPAIKPKYDQVSLSPYGDLDTVGENETADPYHYGKSLLDLIRSYPGQEIGSHTFSHYYCCEPGQDVSSFRADLGAAAKTAQAFGLKIRSIVFPRNQSNAEYLQACREFGIICYRGTERSRFYVNGTRQGESLLMRGGRLLDAYIDLTGPNTYFLNCEAGLVNLPASRFLRPYKPLLAAFDGLKYRRIVRGIKDAAQNGKTYHLWWHPHNFGIHLPDNIAFLGRILDFFAKMRKEYGMQSLAMGEAANLARHAC